MTTSTYNIDAVFRELLLHIKAIQGGNKSFYTIHSWIHTDCEPEEFDQRRLAIAYTKLEEAILWYNAAAGEMPRTLKIKEKL